MQCFVRYLICSWFIHTNHISQCKRRTLAPRLIPTKHNTWHTDAIYIIYLFISVQNAFEARFKITNMQWDVKLNDRGSEVYQSLSNQIAKNIATIFAIYPSAKEDLVVKVVKFSSDEGVRVTSTLWWRSPQELHLTSQSSVMKILIDSIRKDNGGWAESPSPRRLGSTWGWI